MVASKHVDFVNFLKKFENDILAIPSKYCVIVCSTVANHLDHMFDKYVNIYTMNQSDIESLLMEIQKHTQNYHVNLFIRTEIMFRLRQSSNYSNQLIGQNMVKTHLFKIH
jgi:hypothetical protein